MSIVTQLNYTTDLDRGVMMHTPKSAFLTGDQEAHQIHVHCQRAGAAAVDLTGATVHGYFIRADGSTVVLEGTATGHTAVVTLSAPCYAVPGRFSLVIKARLGNVIHTILWLEGTVNLSCTDTVIDAGEIVPDLDQLLAKIAVLEQATADANAAAASVEAFKQSITQEVAQLTLEVNKSPFSGTVATETFVDITGTQTMETGSYYRYQDGRLTTMASTKRVYMPVTQGDKYAISAEIGYNVGLAVFFDAQGAYMGYQHNEASKLYVVDEEVIIPQGCCYAGFCTLTANGYELVIKKSQRASVASLFVIGDSVANGFGSSNYAYGELLRDQYGMQLTKDAADGTTLAVQADKTNSICERVAAMTGTYDYILLEGGLNDAASDLPLGQLTDHYNGGYATDTVIGAVEQICFTLAANHFKSKKLFVLTHRNVSSAGTVSTKQTTYFDAIITALEKWGISYVDLRKISAFGAYNTAIANTYFRDADRIHPTRAAYESFYLPCIAAAMQRL